MSRQTLYGKLKDILSPEKILETRAECVAYSRDMSLYTAVPDLIVLPETTSDVCAVMGFACENGIPVVPRGAGTSVTGAVIPVRGGIVMDLSGLNAVRDINFPDRYAVVEPGVICSSLNRKIGPGFFFPPDPGSRHIATIGGMISTNASGRRALKYGTTAQYVMALEIVLPSGELIRTGHRTPKASAGFDLTRLFACAEGTLGVITEATLRFLPRPEETVVCLAGFPDVQTAAETAVLLITSNIPLSSCELMDCVSLSGFAKGTGYEFPNVSGMLIMEIDGYRGAVEEQIKETRRICRSCGGDPIYTVSEPNARQTIWKYRHKLVSALNSNDPCSRLVPMAEDIGVPVSRVPEAVKRTKALAEAHEIPVVLFGHAGDGNIHTTFVINPDDREQLKRARALAEALNEMAVEMEGTVSAEHGVGLSKSMFIERELGKTHQLMRRIKEMLDPGDIMNPGKLGFQGEGPGITDHFVFGSPEPLEGPEDSHGEGFLCMMCGGCRSVCPVFSVTGRESDNARSKVQLSWALRTGALKLSESVSRSFYRCTGCGACEANCPSRTGVTDLVASARRRLFREGLAPRGLTAVHENIVSTGNRYGKAAPPLAERVCRRKGSILIFPGCRYRFSSRGLSTLISVLEAIGEDYRIFDSNEICCGLPLLNAGDQEGFLRHARKMTEAFSRLDPSMILSPCPGCLSTLENLYPANSGPFFSSVPEYLAEALEGKKGIGPGTMDFIVTYHDPCYLARKRKTTEAPRTLLQKICGLSLVEMTSNREKTVCCGNLISDDFPDTARQMALKRVGQARETGAEILVTACPSCEQALRGHESGPVIMDITSVVAKRLGIDPSPLFRGSKRKTSPGK